LVDERLRDVIGRAGHKDGVERRGFRPALVAVAGADVDVGESEPFEIALGAPGQRLDENLECGD